MVGYWRFMKRRIASSKRRTSLATGTEVTSGRPSTIVKLFTIEIYNTIYEFIQTQEYYNECAALKRGLRSSQNTTAPRSGGILADGNVGTGFLQMK